MVKVIYANKETRTVVHDIYLECKEDEVKTYIRNMGRDGFEFPDKLAANLPSSEIDNILFSLITSNESREKIVDSFYIACDNKIWQEVDSIDVSNMSYN